MDAEPVHTVPEWREIEEDVRAQLRRKPDDPELLGRMAQAYRGQGRLYARRLFLKHAVAVAPLSAELRRQYADSLADEHYLRAASAQVQQSLKLEKSGEAYALQGRVLWQLGRERTALQAWEAAWKAQPPSLDAGLALTRVDIRNERYDEAAQRARLLTALSPKNNEVREVLAEALAGLNDVPGAIHQLERIASQGDASADVYLHLAGLHRRDGDLASAEEDLTRGRRIDPENPMLDRLDELLRRPPSAERAESGPYRPLNAPPPSKQGD